MLNFLNKLFTEQLKLSPDLWLIILTVVVAAAFIITLVVGLVAGDFKTIKSNMKAGSGDVQKAYRQMTKMPSGIKALYKSAMMSNLRPSMLVTQQACVDEPYKRSAVSKIWLTTFIATVVCAALAYVILPIATLTVDEAVVEGETAALLGPAFILIVGGLLTLVGAIIGKLMRSGAAGAYGKFVHALDGDAGKQQQQPQQQQPQGVYEEPHVEATAYEPEAEPVEQASYAEAQPVYDNGGYNAEPTASYGGAAYEEPVAVVEPEQTESDEEIRRRAREEALAQARAAQQEAARMAEAQAAAQAQAQAQAQAAAPHMAEPQAAAQGSSSVDAVIAEIEKISAEGATREKMREVATLLKKERDKPENKTPEQQKRLNDALSKLLKAMSASTRR